MLLCIKIPWQALFPPYMPQGWGTDPIFALLTTLPEAVLLTDN